MKKKLSIPKIMLAMNIVFVLMLILVLSTTNAVQAQEQNPTPTPTAENLSEGNEDQAETTPIGINVPSPLDHPGSSDDNSCYDCHKDIEDHNQVTSGWKDSVHGKAGITCADCHGGDPRSDEMGVSMNPDAGFVAVPVRKQIPEICGGCHADATRMGQYNLPTDQYLKYITSVHGRKLAKNDTTVAICSDCHGSHNVLKASDPASPAYPLNIPTLCSSCHSNEMMMLEYEIPTDQFEVYAESVHGKALLEEQDMRAPNCASCHGSHAARPPSDEEVINVCGKCHTATQQYYQESLHSRIGDAAPKCWTCHGTHDVSKPDETLFFHPTPPDQQCTTCHLDDTSFNMDKSRFEDPDDRRCDTCHHPDSWIYTQIDSLWVALTEAGTAYEEAEQTIEEAARRGMIVNEAEVILAEAFTNLLQARAKLHTTKLPVVTELTENSVAASNQARSFAEDELDENVLRRQAMIIAVGVIFVNIFALTKLKSTLKRK
jgi:hypothetical protein